jgi:transposase InsO family protein
LTAPLVVDALNTAASTRHTGLNGRKGAESQFTFVNYTDRIRELGVSASIGTVDHSYDNALVE